MVQFNALQKLPATQIFFPLFLMLSIHEPIILCSCFTDSSFLVFFLWAATAPIALLSACPVGLCCRMGSGVGSGRGKWLRGICGKLSGVGFELGCVGGAFFKVQLKPM